MSIYTIFTSTQNAWGKEKRLMFALSECIKWQWPFVLKVCHFAKGQRYKESIFCTLLKMMKRMTALKWRLMVLWCDLCCWQGFSFYQLKIYDYLQNCFVMFLQQCNLLPITEFSAELSCHYQWMPEQLNFLKLKDTSIVTFTEPFAARFQVSLLQSDFQT